MKRPIRLSAPTLSLACLLITAPAAYSATFRTFDFPGSTQTQANGINNAGDIVGGYIDSAHVAHGFLLSRGRFTTIDFPGATLTDAHGITPSGQIVGTYIDAADKGHGFLLVPRHIHDHRFPGLPLHVHSGHRRWRRNRRGVRAGQRSTRDHSRLSPVERVFTTIDVPGAVATECDEINGAGQIVGNYSDAGFVGHGFLLSGGVFTTIDPPGSVETLVLGINAGGDIVGAYRDSAGVEHAFLAQGF